MTNVSIALQSRFKNVKKILKGMIEPLSVIINTNIFNLFKIV